ncbi:hypothetical protein P7K49_019445 [Saguinus oedipus]|uniref:Uncharacterized protein n=1 Tax=Saguinus oedipus TaxID=9490 RepID=A0ABQ9UXE7_SAGOE|nr:hypothetical protein P7K49_019445 [Saguinus oedipus]
MEVHLDGVCVLQFHLLKGGYIAAEQQLRNCKHTEEPYLRNREPGPQLVPAVERDELEAGRLMLLEMEICQMENKSTSSKKIPGMAESLHFKRRLVSNGLALAKNSTVQLQPIADLQ